MKRNTLLYSLIATSCTLLSANGNFYQNQYIELYGDTKAYYSGTEIIEPIYAPDDTEKTEVIDNKTHKLFSDGSSLAGVSLTLGGKIKLVEEVASVNFETLLTGNLLSDETSLRGYLEEKRSSAYFNVANLELNLYDTKFILGRQYLNIPQISGFDWLMAPGSFEAYRAENRYFDNLVLSSTYIRTWKPNNAGESFIDLSEHGDVWSVGAQYKTDETAINLFVNYNGAGFQSYNRGKTGKIGGDYIQYYADGSYHNSGVTYELQVINTNYMHDKTSVAYGGRVSSSYAGIDFSAALSRILENTPGFIGSDAFYTSSYNSIASKQFTNADLTLYKVALGKSFENLDITLSYAGYGSYGKEFDAIVDYQYDDHLKIGGCFSRVQYMADKTDATTPTFDLYLKYSF